MVESKHRARSVAPALVAVVACVVVLAFTTAAPATTVWSRGVTEICAHALLFEGSHEIGTRAGAVAVAQDIRASTERRLTRVAELPVPATQQGLAVRWMDVERRLAGVYATSYLRIFDVIAAAQTPAQQAQAPRLLGKALHAPDRLSGVAALLEARLHVPDCTGGTARPSPANPSLSASVPTHR